MNTKNKITNTLITNSKKPIIAKNNTKSKTILPKKDKVLPDKQKTITKTGEKKTAKVNVITQKDKTKTLSSSKIKEDEKIIQEIPLVEEEPEVNVHDINYTKKLRDIYTAISENKIILPLNNETSIDYILDLRNNLFKKIIPPIENN